jgi:hypothetical protein
VRVESVVAARGIVLARPVEKGAMLATPRATLGGRRVVHFELPRKVNVKVEGGEADLGLVGFVLAEVGDVVHFPVGAVVEYRDDDEGGR